MAACDSKEAAGGLGLEPLNKPGRFGTWAILFLSPPGRVGGGRGARRVGALEVVGGVEAELEEAEEEEELAAAFASWCFLKRSIIIIPGLSRGGAFTMVGRVGGGGLVGSPTL